MLINTELCPYDLRRHADLATTQRYLEKVNDSEAIRWIETLCGRSGRTDGGDVGGLPLMSKISRTSFEQQEKSYISK